MTEWVWQDGYMPERVGKSVVAERVTKREYQSVVARRVIVFRACDGERLTRMKQFCGGTRPVFLFIRPLDSPRSTRLHAYTLVLVYWFDTRFVSPIPCRPPPSSGRHYTTVWFFARM